MKTVFKWQIITHSGKDNPYVLYYNSIIIKNAIIMLLFYIHYYVVIEQKHYNSKIKAF